MLFRSETEPEYRKLRDFLAAPDAMLGSFIVHRTLSGMCIGALLVFLMSDLIKADGYTGILWTILSVFGAAVVVSALADEIPRRLAEKYASEKTALKAYPFVRALMIIMKPFTLLINGLSFVFGKLLGVSARSKVETVTEEEILMMVDAGNETGVIEDRKSTRLNSSHTDSSRMPSSA